MGRSLDVALVSRDSSRLVAFYRDVVGLEMTGELRVSGVVPDGRLTRLAAGESTLKVLQFDAEPERDAPGGAAADATGLRYLTVGVVDLAAVLRTCAEIGVPVDLPLTVLNPEVAIAFVHDPDGNVVELVGVPPRDA